MLAVALLHGSFNASGSLSIVDGWQYLPAMAVLALLVGLARLRANHRVQALPQPVDGHHRA